MADQKSTVEANLRQPGYDDDAATETPLRRLLAGRFRWVICALLLFGTTKNYMDRQVLGILKGPLQHDLGWNEIDFGNLVLAFQAFYAIGMASALLGIMIYGGGTIASMIMGAGPEQHGVTSNEWETNKFEIAPTVVGPGGMFPTIFGLLRAQRPS